MSCITKLLELKGDRDFLPITNEPDYSTVIEGGGSYKDHEYIIVFTSRGFRCAYVATNQDIDTSDDSIECHGGITFSASDHMAKDLLPVPCSDNWIGIDAAHYLDLSCAETTNKYFGHTKYVYKNYKDDIRECQPEHRSYIYMESECRKIIDQLVERLAS